MHEIPAEPESERIPGAWMSEWLSQRGREVERGFPTFFIFLADLKVGVALLLISINRLGSGVL